jgi:murein DD-endopeptidase MepM/ murein hydrolase activator NlpD
MHLRFKYFIIIVNVLAIILVGSISAQSVDYQSKIAETQRQAQELSNQVSAINGQIEDSRRRQNTLADEIAKLNEEATTFINIGIQAKSLAAQYESQKRDLEIEISKLQDDMKRIYKDLQKQGMSSMIQDIFTAKNLGEVLGKIYATSSLEQKAANISDQTKLKVAEKEQAIVNQKQVAVRAEVSERQAREKQGEVQQLLEQTKGDEAKYREYADQKNQEIEQQQALKSKYEAEERAEQERIRIQIEENQRRQEEAQRQAQLSGTKSNFSPSKTYGSPYIAGNVGFEASDYGFSGKCRFESISGLGLGKGTLVVPTAGNFEREFGTCNHDGIDISNSTGTPIYAAAGGKVVRAQYTGDGYGNNIVIEHSVSGVNFYTLYGHMVSLGVSTGSSVSAGQEIGKMGSTGNSTGPHLHFMIISGAGYDGPNCRYGSSKCFRPREYINF